MKGIYKITNTINNKIYIGSSNNITLRWNQHLENLFYNIHENYKLQTDFNKYGLSSFMFSIIEVVKSGKKLLDREQYWIDSIDVENNYNILGYASYEYIDRIKDNYDIINFKPSSEQKQLLKKNINIFSNEKLNNIGEFKNNLSKSWFNKAKKNDIKVLKNNICNYFQHYVKTKDIYWTTFTSYQRLLSGKGYTKKFVSLVDIPIKKANTLVFAVNLYSNPFIKNKIKIDDSIYALKVLLKWIINVSDINKQIDIYIPSSRMRNMLTDWLNSFN